MKASNKIMRRFATLTIVPDYRRRIHRVMKGPMTSPTVVETFTRKPDAVKMCLKLAAEEGNRGWGGYWISSPLKKDVK